MKTVIFINSHSWRKAAILCRNAGLRSQPNYQMEFLIVLLIGFVIAIFVLPFVALAKANSAKRGVDDLVRRLSSLENELHNLRPQSVAAVKTEAPATAPAPTVESVAPPLALVTPALVPSETAPQPPPRGGWNNAWQKTL